MSANQILGVSMHLGGDAEHRWRNPPDDESNDNASDGPMYEVGTRPAHGSALHGAICSEVAVVRIRSAGDLHNAISPAIAAMLDQGYSHRDMFAMRLALEEAIVNAVKHGNASDPAKEVRVRFRVTNEVALAEVEDEGPGFDPHTVKDPLATENLERPCGRGLLLMEYYMTTVRYNERGNIVTLGRLRSWE
jgi:serine/threonine-protein kinase RsbW